MSDNMLLALLLIGPVVFIYIWYTKIISRRNSAQEALSGIDVQLQKRGELIPNILKIANKMMEHEKILMEDITKLREQTEASYDEADKTAVKDHLSKAQLLSDKMGQFMVRMEQYPDIKSNETMVQAQQSYNEVEAQISAARRFYNSSVTALNNAVQIFPGNIIAGMINIQEMPFYEAPEETLKPVNADQYLS